MAKCCCAPEINSAKLQVLNAIAANGRVVPAFIPARPTVFPAAEEIARRVADLLNKPAPPNSDGVQQQLDAIVNALITLKAREPDTKLLLQILRNQNDAFDLQKQYQREINIRIDALATREQSKDLLQAIRLLRIDMLEQFRISAKELSVRFAAIGAAIIALGLAQKAAFVAEIAAKAAQTAAILRAIAAIRFPTPSGGSVADILPLIAELVQGQLTLQPVTTSIPVCSNVPGQPSTVISQTIDSYAIVDSNGRSTALFQQSVADMVYDLLASGQINCGSSGQLQSEQIGDISGSSPSSDSPQILFPQTLKAKYFTIDLYEIDPVAVRTYKLAGNQSEYGAGNWAIVDSSGRVSGDFGRLFTQSQRLDVIEAIDNAGIRLSLKIGVSARVTAFGASNQ